nr:type IV secretory system conjugative DNA transfer family protein [uncultured Hyphomonas sp.]
MFDHFNNEHFRFGSAGLATEKMVADAGGFDIGQETQFAGMFCGRKMGYSGLAGGIVVAGARSGKLRDWLVYNLCVGASHLNRVILDVKAEAFFIANLLAAEGRYNIVWNPSRIEGLPCHRINPLDYIHINSVSLVDDVVAYCEMVVALSGAPQSRFFELRARWFLQNLSLTLVEMDGVLRLDRLYWAVMHFCAGGEIWIDEIAYPMSRSRFQDVRACEEEIAHLRSSEGGGFDGICGELSKCFACLASPNLRESVSPPYDFSFSQLCESDRLYAVNLCPRPEYVRQWAMPIKAMFLAAKTYRAREPSAPRQVWFIDETAQLAQAEFLLDAYSIGAGAWGVTPFTIWQNTDQMQSLGKNAENILIGSAGLQMYFGIRDMPSANTLSKRIGTQTLEYDDEAMQAKARQDYNEAVIDLLEGGDPLSAGLRARHFGRTACIRSKQQRLIRTPDEILNMPPDKMYVFMDGVPGAIYADRLPYYRAPWMAGRYLGSPYYPPIDRVQIMGAHGAEYRRVITEAVPECLAHFPQYQQSGQWSYVEGFRPCL